MRCALCRLSHENGGSADTDRSVFFCVGDGLAGPHDRGRERRAAGWRDRSANDEQDLRAHRDVTGGQARAHR